MYGMVTISDWDKEIWDVAFILFKPFWSLVLLIPISEPLVIVGLPMSLPRVWTVTIDTLR